MGLKDWFNRAFGASVHAVTAGSTASPTLQQSATAFPLHGQDHAWGITQAELFRRLAITPEATADARWQTLPGGHYFGLDIAQVQVGRASRWPDRPINQVWYAVRSDPQVPHLQQAKTIHERFVREFGAPPSGSARFDVRKQTASGSIATWAEWRCGGVRWRYSTYGAPRAQNGANTVGFLALDWDDEVAMAAPFHHEWQARNAALASVADAEFIASVQMACAATAAQRRYHFDAPADPNADPQLVMAARLLYAPDRLLTPPAIALLDDGKGLWLWRSRAQGCWGASSVTDTVLFGAGSPANCVWTHLTPARGPGSDQLEIGTLIGSRAWQSREQSGDLAEFVGHLQKLPGVRYQFMESMDD